MKIRFFSKYSVIIFLFIFISCMLGCGKLDFFNPKKTTKPGTVSLPVVRGTVIAKVNNYPITLEDLNQEVAAYNDMISRDAPERKIATRDKKLDYLKNELLRRTLLYQEALARGIDRKDDIIQALEKTKQDLLVVELVRQEAEGVDVSSKEIEEYYNTYKEQLKEPEERHLREIVVPTDREANDILIQLLQGVDFASKALERSKATTAKDGGDLGFIKAGDKKFPQFDAVAFSDTLEEGKTSNVFKGPDGYYILKLEAKRGGKQKPLSEMWDDIKNGLRFLKQQKKIEDLIGKLSRDAKIEIYEGEIK